MTTKEKLILENKAWVLEKLCLDKDYFSRIAEMHTPNILWIGSSDSLISVREITNTEPGEILLYQNIAGQVRDDDKSLMAMIEDAIEVHRIEYIVVCGYSHCGGIRDVLLGAQDRPMVKEWLEPIIALYEAHRDELDALDFDQKERRLCELNIKAQIMKLSTLDCIRKAWKKGKEPILLGWYFDLANGSLKEVFSMDANDQIKRVAKLTSP
ncbi:MAG: carbonic anhydrase [Bacteroidota bacterium]